MSFGETDSVGIRIRALVDGSITSRSHDDLEAVCETTREEFLTAGR
ncbi:hypothetical protein [Natrialba swarupiae]|nr:hypothetical protein [Natrialba swarupiae]